MNEKIMKFLIIAILLSAMVEFSVCNAQESKVQKSQKELRQKDAAVAFPQGWEQGWFHMGAAQYCMTALSGSNVSCTISVYGNGMELYFTVNGLTVKNVEAKIGDNVVKTTVNEYGEITSTVNSWPLAEDIADTLSTGGTIVLVIDGKEYPLMPESQVAMQSFPQALKWIKSIKDAAEM